MEWTPERRNEVADRLRKGRENAAAKRASNTAAIPAKQRHAPHGELMDSDLAETTFTEVSRAVNAISADWLIGNVPEAELSSLRESIRGALEHIQKRIQTVEVRSHQQMCAGCNNPLPNGKFAGQITVHDPAGTGKILVWRSCSEGCQRIIEGIAARQRAQTMTGRNQGVRAI